MDSSASTKTNYGAISTFKLHLGAIILIFVAVICLYYNYEYNTVFIKQWLPWFREIIIFEFGHDLNGFLILIPCLYATLVFDLRKAILTWLILVTTISPHITSFTANYTSLGTNILFLLVPLIAVAVISLQSSWRKRERKINAEREKERQGYMLQILKTQEEERRHISRELHDDTIQTLYVLANQLESLLNEDSNLSIQTRRQVELTRDMILSVSTSIRKLSIELRPAMLDDMGIISALRWLIDRLNQDKTVNATMVVTGEERKLSMDTQVMVFRFVQEALNNIKRHAEATEAAVNVIFNSGRINIIIEDNGKGFELPEKRGELIGMGKLGIIGMQERSQLLDGTFNINSRIGGGTVVSLQFKV